MPGCKKSEKTNNTAGASSSQTSTTVFSKFLNVGIDATLPPFAYLQGEEIVGFDVDLASEIAKRLEKELKILKRNIKGGNCNRQVFLEKFWTITFHNFFPVILAF